MRYAEKGRRSYPLSSELGNASVERANLKQLLFRVSERAFLILLVLFRKGKK